MPAVLTHDFFGKDVYAAHADAIGASLDEKHAFLLGNQGPDPLFYLVITMRMKPFFKLGSTMHHEHPTRLIHAFKESLSVLDDDERAVGRAYAAGFLCHYTLDRAMHPLVYSQQFALCDAGIEGLTRADGSEVHGEIERELDEMVLFTKTRQTVKSYRPFDHALRGSDGVLETIGKMHAYVAMTVYRQFAPADMYVVAVHNFRRMQRLFYSPGQAVHRVANALETRVLRRRFSFYKAMAHRDNAILASDFGNHDHRAWENPFTGEVSTCSFWDIFDGVQALAWENICVFDAPDFDAQAAARLTQGLDFSGEPVEDPAALHLVPNAEDPLSHRDRDAAPIAARIAPITRPLSRETN